MRLIGFFIISLLFITSCNNKSDDLNLTDKIVIDSLTSTYYTLKAWDTTSVRCYARGDSLQYHWECNHGSIKGSGIEVKYAAGECCVGINTIICTVSNKYGDAVKELDIEITSYYDDNK